MIYQVGACLTYILQGVANVALPIFNRENRSQFAGKLARDRSGRQRNSYLSSYLSNTVVGDLCRNLLLHHTITSAHVTTSPLPVLV
jgi:hypothetical protein